MAVALLATSQSETRHVFAASEKRTLQRARSETLSSTFFMQPVQYCNDELEAR